MMKRYLLQLCLLLSACWPLWGQASWQVVTHRDANLQPLTVAEVKYLFTEGQVQGQAPELIDLTEESLRAQFYEGVLNMTLNRWRANWAKRVFTGNHRLPKQLALDYVLHYLEANPGAVAYLPDTTLLPPTLKVIYCAPREHHVMGQLTCPSIALPLKKASQR
jgi:hypothetical protein